MCVLGGHLINTNCSSSHSRLVNSQNPAKPASVFCLVVFKIFPCTSIFMYYRNTRLILGCRAMQRLNVTPVVNNVVKLSRIYIVRVPHTYMYRFVFVEFLSFVLFCSISCRSALCCKMSVEYDQFILSGKRLVSKRRALISCQFLCCQCRIDTAFISTRLKSRYH